MSMLKLTNRAELSEGLIKGFVALMIVLCSVNTASSMLIEKDFDLASLKVETRSQTTFDSIQVFKLFYADGVDYELNLAYKGGKPDHYFQNIFTPVCLDNVCEPVYVNFYWDLLGNYIRYDIPVGEIFSKLDHEEFSIEDYEKMHRILSNTQSILKDFKMDELVDSTGYSSSASVDAVTGATKKTIKNEVIDGALYTCYTLWHLAHGEVVDEMVDITKKMTTKKLLHDFLQSTNHHYQYWALDQVIDPSGRIDQEFLPHFLTLIRGNNIFSARHALRKIPGQAFLASVDEAWLWETFQLSKYPLQIDILNKLEESRLSSDLCEKLSEHMDKSNEEVFLLIFGILSFQERLPLPTLRTLGSYLDNGKYPQVSHAIFKLLDRHKTDDIAVSRQMESYKLKVKTIKK